MFATSPVRQAWRTAALLLATILVGCAEATDPVAPLALTRPHAQVGPATVVTNTDDDGPGSLRQALLDTPDGGVIQFDPSIAGQVIALSTGRLIINK
jgi:hypothetical protein